MIHTSKAWDTVGYNNYKFWDTLYLQDWAAPHTPPSGAEFLKGALCPVVPRGESQSQEYRHPGTGAQRPSTALESPPEKAQTQTCAEVPSEEASAACSPLWRVRVEGRGLWQGWMWIQERGWATPWQPPPPPPPDGHDANDVIRPVPKPGLEAMTSGLEMTCIILAPCQTLSVQFKAAVLCS